MEGIQLISNIKSSTNSYNILDVSTLDLLIKYIDNINPNIVFVDKKVYFNHEKLQLLSCIEVFESIEENKYFDTTSNILNIFLKYQLKKNSKVVVIGGGIIQDMIGFCCSIYARGIPYYLVPTTLLSQCDSCVGGKTSINFENKKNLLGTFYPPKEILLCSDFINTLTNEDFLSGLGEVFKFNCLQYNLENFKVNLIKYKTRLDIKLLVNECLTYKSKIIEIDEFDQNERKFLNFGHTFGHALESTSNFKIQHGSGVVFGIMIAYWISSYFELISQEKVDIIEKISLELISNIEVEKKWFSFKELIPCIKSDKKNTGQVVMVLPTNNTFILEKIEDGNLELAYIYAFEKLNKILKLK